MITALPPASVQHAHALRSLAPHLETPATSLLMNININLMNAEEAVGAWAKGVTTFTQHTLADTKEHGMKEKPAGQRSGDYTPGAF